MKVDSMQIQEIAKRHSNKVAGRLLDGNVSSDDLAWAETVINRVDRRADPKGKADAFALRESVQARLKAQGPRVSEAELAKDRGPKMNADELRTVGWFLLVLMHSR